MNQKLSGTASAGASKKRKFALQMVVGVVAGAAATLGLLTTLGDSGFAVDDPSRLIALLTGLVITLIGLAVGLGVIAPKPGAHLLNVEDADELREQRGPLWRAAVGTLLLGAIMLALALARIEGSVGVFDAEVAAGIAAIGFVGVCVLSFAGRKDQDELMLSVSREAMGVAMYSATALLGVWGAAAHLGLATWITPLGTINLLLLVQLGAIVVVSARRGLFRPR